MLFIENSYLKELESDIVNIKKNQITLNQTIFYAKSGGQPGDIGTLSNNESNVNIIETVFDEEKNIIHITEEDIKFNINEKIIGKINWKTRYKHMRMHSALHLLCSLIPFDVTGGQIRYDKSRLDFNVQDSKIDKEESQKALKKPQDKISEPKVVSIERENKKEILLRNEINEHED